MQRTDEQELVIMHSIMVPPMIYVLSMVYVLSAKYFEARCHQDLSAKLIPNTPRPMMWYNIHGLITTLFQLRDGIVKEEIDQYGIYMRAGVKLHDLASDQVNSVNATAAQLGLPS